MAIQNVNLSFRIFVDSLGLIIRIFVDFFFSNLAMDLDVYISSGFSNEIMSRTLFIFLNLIN